MLEIPPPMKLELLLNIGRQILCDGREQLTPTQAIELADELITAAIKTAEGGGIVRVPGGVTITGPRPVK